MTTPNRKLRWGVLGYARIAREALIPAIQRSANSQFHALASRDAARLAEARARFGVARTYPGYAELLRDPEVDAVYLPLPNSLHREWTIKAAEQGKHVLCEKPLALTAAEGREMAAACAAHGVTLMEAFMYRYTDRTRQVQEVLRGSLLGEIKSVSATFRFRLANPASIKLRPELGGGALYDVGCYPVNFIGLVADGPDAAAAGTARPASVAVECVRVRRHRHELFGAAALPVGAGGRPPLRLRRPPPGFRGDHRHQRRAGNPRHLSGQCRRADARHQRRAPRDPRRGRAIATGSKSRTSPPPCSTAAPRSSAWRRRCAIWR